MATRMSKAIGAIGIRRVMVLGPTRPPFPRPYRGLDGTVRDVSFEQQAETIGTLVERHHGKGRVTCATLMPVYREATHDPAKVREIEAQGRVIRDIGSASARCSTRTGIAAARSRWRTACSACSARMPGCPTAPT
jgi:hypothetical protein